MLSIELLKFSNSQLVNIKAGRLREMLSVNRRISNNASYADTIKLKKSRLKIEELLN